MKNKDLFIVQNEKAFIMDIIKRYWPKKAVEIELAEAIKKGIVETPPKTLRKTPPIDVKLPLVKEVTPNEPITMKPLIKEKDLLANAPNDPSLVY